MSNTFDLLVFTVILGLFGALVSIGPVTRKQLSVERNGVKFGIQGSCYIYSSPSILQTSTLRPPLIIRPLDLVPKGKFSVLNDLYFKTTCNIRPHFLGPMGGLKIEGPLYMGYISPFSVQGYFGVI